MFYILLYLYFLNSDSDNGGSLLRNKSIRLNDELEKLSGESIHVDSEGQLIAADSFDRRAKAASVV